MRVTRFQYPLEEPLVKKIDLMIERCTTKRAKKDAVLICEGAEGEGKTTLSVALAYYISEQMKVPFDESHVFFDLRKLIEFAQSTQNQIIIWDEPALQALSTDWAKAVVQDLTRLLMMARKKRHFIIINVTKFYKFNEYVIVDRPLGLIHVYSRKNIYSGRFMYIRKKYLEPLWRDYKFSKKRSYKKYASKKIRGTFPDILNKDYKYNVLSEFDNDKYESEKDKAIAMIGSVSKEAQKDIRLEFLKRILFDPALTNVERARVAGISLRSVVEWRNKLKKEDPTLVQRAKSGRINNLGTTEPTYQTEDITKGTNLGTTEPINPDFEEPEEELY